ncbi:ethylene-insensitive protein 2.2-like [Quercus suber]|uniref:ethylene-insensitive protein 2.2-like n=1 Tax=Quercus suber TaxID=58331 RepID=UPI0032DF95E2
MEAENFNSYRLPDGINRLLPVVVPVLLVSVGCVDPGKWAATVEGGARFGSELVVLMLIFNFAAILCQYLSAGIGLVTGRDLAQICSDEYDKFTCIILGVQTEVSVIALDLTMVLGLAHGLKSSFWVGLVHLCLFDCCQCCFISTFCNPFGELQSKVPMHMHVRLYFSFYCSWSTH